MLFVYAVAQTSWSQCQLVSGNGFEDAVCAASDPLLCTCENFSTEQGGWDGEINPTLAATSVSAGHLVISPAANSVWFNQSSGYQLYRLISGNFAITARVLPRRAGSADLAPLPTFRLGGINARSPQSDDCDDCENYVFIVLGADGNDVSVETKSTVDSQSNFIGPSWPAVDGDIRLCRLGAEFRLYVREIGQSNWQLENFYTRADLPDTLQVGPHAYANTSPADLDVYYDFVDFATPDSVADCELP